MKRCAPTIPPGCASVLLGLWVSLISASCIDATRPSIPAEVVGADTVSEETSAGDDVPPIEDGTPAEVIDTTCQPTCDHGTCGPGDICVCEPGWTGAACDKAICEAACKNGGVCIAPNECLCANADYAGPLCDEPVCLGGCGDGSCLSPGTCICPDPFIGENCEIAVRCEAPCLNGGRCVGIAECDCSGTDFGGATCQFRSCSGVICPTLAGFTATCNLAEHCEYEPINAAQDWRRDVIWIWVPPGDVVVGSRDVAGKAVEKPQHTATVATGFFVSKFETTIGVFDACSDSGACPYRPHPEGEGIPFTGATRTATHPKGEMTQQECQDVCAFVGGRLPSEVEWTMAAKGPEQDRAFPWGARPLPVCGTHAVFDNGPAAGCGTASTAAVGFGIRTEGMSAVGAIDMAGNAGERVADCWHASYIGAPTDAQPWLTSCDLEVGVVRGGTASDGAADLRTDSRVNRGHYTLNWAVGVRCVRDLPQ